MAAKAKKTVKTEVEQKPAIVRDLCGDRIVSADVASEAKRRFWRRTTIQPENGCWLWGGCRQNSGHGRMTFFKRPIEAHRLSYMAYVGAIPVGLDLDHVCRVPNCINPDHLEPVTRRENTLRGNTVPAKLAARTHCNHGHPFSGENLGTSNEGYRHCLECKRIQARARYHRRKDINLAPANRREAIGVVT